MSFFIVGGATALVGLMALFASSTFGIAALLISALFGAASAVSLPGIGGIQPTHALLGVLLLMWATNGERRKALFEGAQTPTAFWLLLTFVIGAAGAFFLPALFDGKILVYPIRAEDLADGVTVLPLAPTPGNVTQIVYFAADVLCFLLVSAYVRTEQHVLTMTKLVIAYAFANIFFGFADIVTSRTGTSAALEFMRNASYVIFDSAGDGGLDRVKGSFTEASAFAYATTGCFAFGLRLWLEGLYPRASLAIAVLSFAFLLLSASSTAYLAAALCSIILYVGSFIRVVGSRPAPKDFMLIFGFPVVSVGAVLVALMIPSLHDSIQSVLDTVIFDKSDSESGIERAAMNAAGLQAFVASYGLGVGIGSTRASSFIVAILSSLGLIGSLTYAAFLLTPLVARREWACLAAGKAHAALRSALLAWLVAASISGALIDLGIAFFAIAAAVAAVPCARTVASPGRSAAVPPPPRGIGIGNVAVADV